MDNDEKIKEYEAHKTPVPSYEEWQASEKYNKHLEEVIKIYERKDKQATETSIAYNELLEENAQLKERNESLNNRDINLCRIANEIRDENFALKELLKECVELMDSTGAIAMHIDVYRQRKKDVLNAISQVLGEDKW